jgi:phosphoenolpyruvate carboxylase
MNLHAPEAALVATDLLALTARLRERAGEDPFGNPVLAVALAISRRLDDGSLGEAGMEALIRVLRDRGFDDRAARLAGYVGGVRAGATGKAFAGLAQRLVRPDPSDSPVQFARFRESLERIRFAAVFTAHPTFAVPVEVFAALAETACGRPGERFATHRPQKPTLEQEFAEAVRAIGNGRDAIDGLNDALFRAASAAWPDRWADLAPRPIVLASWVGYDTDGRVDIDWWDTLRLRLRMKRLQLERIRRQVEGVAAAMPIAARLDRAIDAVAAQIDAAPESADPDAVAAFASAVVGGREEAIVTPAPLVSLFEQAIGEAATTDERIALAVARAGLLAHGMSLAHTHVRLNAAQVHNAVRLRLGLDAPPADPFRRRVLLSAVNAALDAVEPVAVDFGALIGEQASATRLVMTVAQIAKHVDGETPIRVLIAETESGYTLLSMLWLARLFGVERHIEISPLFETAEALEHGARAIEEALRSPHYRSYLKATGRLTVEFGYSDSGRYVGPLPATFLIERLRMKLAELLVRFDLAEVELILFDTHGESIGRGAHPGSLADRLKYLSPSTSRAAFAAQKIRWRDESSFQGGDGYLLFGTPELAAASIARIAEQVFDPLPTTTDPIYAEADFTVDSQTEPHEAVVERILAMIEPAARRS